jgi:hypothetical protein
LWLAARVAFPVLRRLVANAECPADDPADMAVIAVDQRKVLG